MTKKIATIGLTSFALASAPCWAAFLKVEDFASYNVGDNVDGVGGWNADGDTTFVDDPASPGNTVLRSAETAEVVTTNVYRSIPTIDQTSVGTIFFRARASATADFVLGSSDVMTPTNWPDFEGYMRFAGGNIDVRDGGGFANAGTYNADEWYNIWLVLDHNTDQTTIYASQGLDDAGAALASGAFRTSGNTEHNDLITLFVRNNDPASAGLLDDIYVDPTSRNLSNPVIPEPSTSLLALVAMAFGLRRRRS